MYIFEDNNDRQTRAKSHVYKFIGGFFFYQISHFGGGD